MDYKRQTLEELGKNGGKVSALKALVGLDGFVDRIVAPVDKRMGQGDKFEPIGTIGEFGARISAAAGKSTNIELFLRREKVGGNGPLMAGALLGAGVEVKLIGALGVPHHNHVFNKLVQKTDAVSIANPGITYAAEFHDGKIMFGLMSGLDEISYPNIIKVMGEGAFIDALSRPDLISLVNWTMIANMTSIMVAILEKVLPNLGPREGNRLFFFDLADPEKRSEADLKAALKTISRFRAHGRATLGLNLKEAQHVYRVLGFAAVEPDATGLKKMAADIRQELDLTCLVIHPTASAACATKDDAWWVEGPYTDAPLITTGAGDHFNAGFALGQLLNMPYPCALTLAASFSGHYVRTGESPTLTDIDSFISNWR